MAFFTRPELTDDQFKQLSTSILTLSGETDFVGTLKSKGIEIDASTGYTSGSSFGHVLTFDGTKIRLLSPSGGTAGGSYPYDDISTITVGGIPAGTPLLNEPLVDLWQRLLVVYQEPTFPSFNISIPSLNEVGNPASWSGNQTFTWSTSNSGNVEPNTIQIRDITNATILGSGLANDGTELLALGAVIANATPITHTWRIEGTNTELNAMTPRNKTIESIYPWFYGTFDAGAVPAGTNRPDPTNAVTAQALIDAGTKVVTKSNGTLTANFSSTAQDYIWVAIPSSSTVKTVWYVNALDNGAIGGVVSPGGNLFPSPVTNNVDEPVSVYWSGITYRFYVSNKQVAATSMEFRNS